ncbi:hypothetical protein KIPB_017375, partial [Kipferlia bialata]|eukprot:g17375.t1
MQSCVKAPPSKAGGAPEGYEHSGLDASLWNTVYPSLYELLCETDRQTVGQE